MEKTKEEIINEKLRQLFRNRANAYIDTKDGSVVQGMDDDCFIEVVKQYASQEKQKVLEAHREYITERIFADDNWASVETLKEASDEYIKYVLPSPPQKEVKKEMKYGDKAEECGDCNHQKLIDTGVEFGYCEECQRDVC